MWKRWLVAVPFVLFVLPGLGWADYFILVANVGQSNILTTDPMKGTGPGIGMGPMTPPMLPPMGRPPIGTGVPSETGDDVTPQLVLTTVEYEGTLSTAQAKNFVADGQTHKFKHHWGQTMLLSPKQMSMSGNQGKVHVVAWVPLEQDPKTGVTKTLGIPSLTARYTRRSQDAFKDKGDAANVLELAKWTLRHGMVDKYVEVMEKFGAENKTRPEYDNFQKVQAALSKATKDPSGPWKEYLQRDKQVERSAHYVLYHDLQNLGTDAGEARVRLERLETNLRIYYFWFALNGYVLPVPEERIPVAMLSNNLTQEQKKLGATAIEADGFLARREGLAFLSSRRWDENYDLLEKFSTSRLSGRDRQELLKPRKDPKDIDDQQAMTLGLMLKAMEIQGEIASSSHNGTRQLLFASGLLPRNVHAPDWLLSGMGSFFETPVDAPWPMPTGPNVTQLATLKKLKEKGLIDKSNPKDTLRKVVTNAYFREVEVLLTQAEKETIRSTKIAGLKTARERAEATAWAMVYFLAGGDRVATTDKNRDGLMRYFKELSAMPRDLELDEDTLWVCFAKAFGAWDSARQAVKEEVLENLAKQWYAKMESNLLGNLEPEAERLMAQVKRAHDEVYKIATSGAQQGGPPMGGGGIGGPFPARP
jgi:hypothetical protein